MVVGSKSGASDQGVGMNMAKERAVDEYFGFVERAVAKNDDTPAPADAPVTDDGAYEDSWYQVLKAKAGETDEA